MECAAGVLFIQYLVDKLCIIHYMVLDKMVIINHLLAAMAVASTLTI